MEDAEGPKEEKKNGGQFTSWSWRNVIYWMCQFYTLKRWRRGREREEAHTHNTRALTDIRIKEGRDHVGRQQLPRFVSAY